MTEMTSTEDMLGWLFVLREWKPGDVRHGLWPLLDKIQVGSGKYSEEKATAWLDSLDAEGLRTVLHVPADDELAVAGFPDQARERVNQAMPASLAGLKRLVELRQEEDRLRVRAFNKLKHHFVALRRAASPGEVLIPVWKDLDETANEIRMATLTIEATPENARVMASRSIIAQATLNSWLGIIMWTRYDEPYENPVWAVRALALRGWRE